MPVIGEVLLLLHLRLVNVGVLPELCEVKLLIHVSPVHVLVEVAVEAVVVRVSDVRPGPRRARGTSAAKGRQLWRRTRRGASVSAISSVFSVSSILAFLCIFAGLSWVALLAFRTAPSPASKVEGVKQRRDGNDDGNYSARRPAVALPSWVALVALFSILAWVARRTGGSRLARLTWVALITFFASLPLGSL